MALLAHEIYGDATAPLRAATTAMRVILETMAYSVTRNRLLTPPRDFGDALVALQTLPRGDETGAGAARGATNTWAEGFIYREFASFDLAHTFAFVGELMHIDP